MMIRCDVRRLIRPEYYIITELDLEIGCNTLVTVEKILLPESDRAAVTGRCCKPAGAVVGRMELMVLSERYVDCLGCSESAR